LIQGDDLNPVIGGFTNNAKLILNETTRVKYFCLYLLLIVLACHPPSKKTVLQEQVHLNFIGQYVVPHNKMFQQTTIGGLSGIDYDSTKDLYYLICDDRSSINPSRFYTARIFFNAKGIDSVNFLSVHALLQPSGRPYPDSKTDPLHVPDPEGIRFNPSQNELVWTSEGERIVRPSTLILEDPSIIAITTDGKYKDSFLLPPNMHMQASEKGPRQNGVFEGLTFTDDFKTLFVNVEEPVYEDGPRAGLPDTTGLIRIICYDAFSRKPVAQYGYRIEPVEFPADPESAFKINGVPDILWVGDNKLLVIERSFSTGRKGCTIRVFLADLATATDVRSVPSLRSEHNWKPVTKKLLLNMDELGMYIDNIEGVTFGPRLPNGRRTLLFVADNNFSPDEITQFLLFELND
jgi:hypothetical protein